MVEDPRQKIRKATGFGRRVASRKKQLLVSPICQRHPPQSLRSLCRPTLLLNLGEFVKYLHDVARPPAWILLKAPENQVEQGIGESLLDVTFKDKGSFSLVEIDLFRQRMDFGIILECADKFSILDRFFGKKLIHKASE
jgi:hypothetical protein